MWVTGRRWSAESPGRVDCGSAFTVFSPVLLMGAANPRNCQARNVRGDDRQAIGRLCAADVGGDSGSGDVRNGEGAVSGQSTFALALQGW